MTVPLSEAGVRELDRITMSICAERNGVCWCERQWRCVKVESRPCETLRERVRTGLATVDAEGRG